MVIWITIGAIAVSLITIAIDVQTYVISGRILRNIEESDER